MFDGKTLQKLTGDGAVKMYHVTGLHRGDDFIPPLHAEPRHPRGPADARAALIMIQSVTKSIPWRLASTGATASIATVAFMPILFLVSICSRVSSDKSGVECT